MKYNIGKRKKIRIFGKNFVKNNYENCEVIINNTKKELAEYYNRIGNEEEIEIKLIINKRIIDISNIFSGCKYLITILNLNKLDISNVKNMSGIFSRCKMLEKISDISKWNTSNVTNMRSMFSNCQYLCSLPDISKWNT